VVVFGTAAFAPCGAPTGRRGRSPRWFSTRFSDDDQAHDDGTLGSLVVKEGFLGHSVDETARVHRSLV